MATRADIRTSARIKADQDNSTFPSDDQYNVWIDDKAKDVWWGLVQAGWPVNFSSANLTANGTSQLVLSGTGGTVAMVRGVFRQDAGGQYVELQRMQEGQRAGLYSPNGQQMADYYDVLIDPTLGTVIELLPAPASGVYRVDYVLDFPGFASDTTVWYGPSRTAELIATLVAAEGLAKEGDAQGAAVLEAKADKLREKILETASWLDARNPARVRDVESMRRFVDPFAYQVDGLYP
jgi:hypothetical protein